MNGAAPPIVETYIAPELLHPAVKVESTTIETVTMVSIVIESMVIHPTLSVTVIV